MFFLWQCSCPTNVQIQWSRWICLKLSIWMRACRSTRGIWSSGCHVTVLLLIQGLTQCVGTVCIIGVKSPNWKCKSGWDSKGKGACLLPNKSTMEVNLLSVELPYCLPLWFCQPLGTSNNPLDYWTKAAALKLLSPRLRFNPARMNK